MDEHLFQRVPVYDPGIQQPAAPEQEPPVSPPAGIEPKKPKRTVLSDDVFFDAFPRTSADSQNDSLYRKILRPKKRRRNRR